uniref:Rab-like protein 2A isoform X4 n=1 Tax=Phascolarctos cinereus TaxID=38626 RepID=A0A6P5JPX2_PHACI|nr:rab-like protein 2A isoform X4 [Phascolarctos cinereus]
MPRLCEGWASLPRTLGGESCPRQGCSSRLPRVALSTGQHCPPASQKAPQNCSRGPRLVFDVQRKVTYKNLTTWYSELREFRPEIPCLVVANKIDADTNVTQKSFNFARRFALPLYFVSAADGTNVVKLFNDAIRLAVSYKQNSQDFMDEVLQELELFSQNFELEKKVRDRSQCWTSTPPPGQEGVVCHPYPVWTGAMR